VPQPGTTPPKYAWLGAAGISTETSLGTGVATQGGASYVPQVARALQTAPVVPPGAFPNGSAGTQFTATPVAAGPVSGAQEIATQFWQKAEAERQKAREEEARRKSEEGMRYLTWGEDPAEEAIYFTIEEAEFWYVTSKANESIDIVYDFLKFLKHDVAGQVIEWMEGQLGLHDPEDWVNTIIAGLGECITTGNFFLEGDGAARCRVGIPMITVFEINVFGTVYAKLEVPDLRKEPNVELCAFYGQECIST